MTEEIVSIEICENCKRRQLIDSDGIFMIDESTEKTWNCVHCWVEEDLYLRLRGK